MILLELIQNIALLVAMAAAYRVLLRHRDGHSLRHQLVSGLLFGGVALVGMMTPVRLMPDLILDGRSIIMGAAGLVGGPLVTLVAGLLAGAYRVWMGGVGTFVGVAIIVEAGALGVAFHYWLRRTGRRPGTAALLAFGLAIHVIMAAMLLTLPGDARQLAWTEAGVAILVVYPLATMLVCRLFLDHERQDRDRASLAQNEALYRTAWASIGDAVIATDARGRVELLNPMAESLTGWRVDEAVGRPLTEVFPVVEEGTGQPLENPVSRILAGEEAATLAASAVLVTRDGAMRPVADSCLPIRDASGSVAGAVLAFRDQSAERAAVQALRESRERTELALTAADLGTWDWNVRTGEVIDRRWAEMLGYGPGEVEPDVRSWNALIHPDDLPRVREVLAAHLEGRTDQFECEHRVRHKSGRWVWVLDRGRVLDRDSGGRPLRAAGTRLDVTERKQALEAVGSREALLANQKDVLLDLMSRGALFGGDLRSAVAKVTEACSTLTGTERVSLWWYSEDYATVRCWDLYERSTGRHSEGEELSSADFPTYAASHRAGQVIATADVRSDPRTREIPASYWDRHDIRSQVDAPVWAEGRVAGSLCFEAVGERREWSPEDERLAPTMAALVSLCVESAGRMRAEAAATGQLAALEKMGAELRQTLEAAERSRRALLSTLEDRKQAEEALRESEARFRRLAENAPDIIYRYRFLPEPGAEYVSSASTAMTGYTPEEHYADPELVFKLVHPDDRHLLEALAAGRFDPTDPLVIRCVRKDGKVIWTEQRSVPIRDADGNVVALEGIAREITERKRQEVALRESEERYRELFESSPQVLWVYDLETLAFLAVNDAAVARYGYGREEFLDMTIADIRPPEDVPALLENVGRVAQGMDEAGIWRHRRKDGAMMWVDIRSHALRYAGRPAELVLVTDVTERVEAEEALARKRQELQMTLRISGTGVWRWDFPSGRVSTTEGGGPISGLSGELYPHTGDAFYELVHPEDRTRVATLVERATATGEYAAEFRILRPDGTVRWVAATGSCVYDAEGRPVALTGVDTDITERRRAESEIRALAEVLEVRVRERTQELQAANAELESFSYSVSHDLKAPLRAIDGYSALLEEERARGLDADGQRLVREIRSNTHQMGQLIEDLLAFSRVGRTTLAQEPVELGALVRDLVDRELRSAPSRRIEVTAEALPAVLADPQLLRQALANVIANAVKFTRPREVARIDVTAQRGEGMVEIAVRDNGVGFDRDYGHKLFRVFERLHYPEEFEGTGVGLAIVKRIVERHGGSVTAESELGQGTVIRLTLPLAREDEWSGPDRAGGGGRA